MTTITVEPTESGILVSEADSTDDAAWSTPLPPLTAARYLVVASEATERIRQSDVPLIESIRAHAHSTLVALEAGFGSPSHDEDAPPAERLAAQLGVTVVAPKGGFISCDGTLFAIGPDNGWAAYSPSGARVLYGRRYPQPSWQSHLPAKVAGTVQIPAGLWVTDNADPSHAVHLADIAVQSQQLLIVVGSPGAPKPEFTRLRDVLSQLPEPARSCAVLIGYDDTSLEPETVRRLAADLQQPIRVAHGVTIAGQFVRLEYSHTTPTKTFACESVFTPQGTVELERWVAPLGMSNVTANTYRLNEEWVVDVIPAGLVLRPPHQHPSDSAEALPIIPGTLTVMLCGEGADQLRRVVGPLRKLLDKLREYAPTQLIPGDTAARRLIRNAFPGVWAPTGRLALTDDGRIIAASVDEEEILAKEEERSEAPGGPETATTDDAADSEAEADTADTYAEPPDPHQSDDIAVASEAHVQPIRDAREPDSTPESHSAQTVATVTPVATSPYVPALASDAFTPDAPATTPPSAPAQDVVIGGAEGPRPPSSAEETSLNRATSQQPSPLGDVSTPVVSPERTRSHARESAEKPSEPHETDTQGPAAALAQQAPDASPSAATDNTPSDALARALRGSAAAAGLLSKSSRSPAFDATDAISGAAGRRTSEVSLPENEAAPRTSVPASRRAARERAESAPAAVGTDDSAHGEATEFTAGDIASEGTHAATAEQGVADESGSVPAPEDDENVAIEVPRDARSTAEQRHRVRTALGARYDVASRTVSQLLAQQPGMRVASGDRSTLLTTLSVVSVFASDPTARYDLDFHTCLAEGLSALPTTRAIVVRGLPGAGSAPTNSVLCSSTPFVSAPLHAPLTGPAEALIWTTTGRRLDRLMAGTDAAADIIVPAHTKLRVLGTADGPVPRLLLAEAGVNDENALSRLHEAAARRENDAKPLDDSRWLGEPLLAV